VSLPSVIRWLKEHDVRACYQLEPITLDQQSDWHFDATEIRHRLDRSFSIGAFCSDRFAPQPLILQPEVGCLGWVTRNSENGSSRGPAPR
jgi:hypothetical protein